MDRPHIIEDVEFDFTFRSARQAIELPIELGPYVVKALLPIVEEVFDSVSRDGEVLQIDSLEIDLGTVRFDELERRFAERLRERLQQLARERRGHPGEGDSSPDRLMTTAESDFELLRYFLEHGHLPWNAAVCGHEGFDQLIRRVVRSSRDQVLRFLRDAGDAERVLDRVLAQFPEDVALELLEPVPAQTAIQDVVAAYAVYEEVRAYLVEGRTGSADALLAAIEMMTRQHPWQGLRFVRELQSGLVLSPRAAQTYGEATRQRVVEALRSVLPDRGAGGTLLDDVLAAAGWPRDAEDGAMIFRLKPEATAAPVTDAPAPSVTDMASGFSRKDDAVDDARAATLVLAAVRAMIFRLKPEPTAAPGTDATAPSGTDVASGFSRKDDARAVAHVVAWLTGEAPWPGDDYVVQTIARLPDPLLADVLRQVRPADHGAWLRGVERIAMVSDDPGSASAAEQLRRAMWDFLLRTARTNAPRMTEQEIAQHLKKAFPAYALYEEVRAYLVEGRTESESALVAAIEMMVHQHPSQALRLLRELQSGVVFSAQVAQRYGAATRQRVVAALRAAMPARALADHVLLDQVLARSGWPVGSSDEEAPRDESSHAEIVARLASWVAGATTWPNDASMERMLAQQPEQLLAAVMRVLRPADAIAWLRGAERVAPAGYREGMALRPDHLRRVKWDFLLQAARTAGPPVTEHEIAQRFATVLAEQTSSTDRPRAASLAPDHDDGQDDEDVVAAYARYEEVRAYLIDGQTASADALLAAVETIAQRHPWQGLRLLRELQSGVALSPRVAQTYDAATRQRLVAALRVVLPDGPEHATIADDAIAAAGWPEISTAQLVAWVTGAEGWPGDERLAHVIARFPESVLAELVRRLRPADHRAWLRGVERIATDTYEPGLAPAVEELRRAKWGFLLQTARSNTPHLTEHEIAQRFEKALPAYALYEEVRAYLVEGRPASERALLETIETLTRQHPSPGLKLLRELQSGFVARPRVVDRAVDRDHEAPAPDVTAGDPTAIAEAAAQLASWVMATAPWPADARVARLLAQQPEQLLTAVVRVLRPADADAWLRGVERVATARHAEGLTLKPEHFQRIKWDFLLQTARTETPTATEQDVSRRFATVLAEQTASSEPPHDANVAPADDKGHDDEDVVAAYAVYEEVRTYLVDGRAESDEALLAAIDKLTGQHPWLGVRLLRELQAGPALSPRVVQSYSAATRQKVVEALRALIFRLKPEATADNMTEAPGDGIARAEAAAQLEAWVTGTAPWPGDERIAQIIARLPDSLLADLVRRLRPADHGAWLRGVERIATASYATKEALAPATLASLKWAFLLRTAQTNARALTERDVAERFARLVAEQTGRARAVETRSALMRQFDRDVQAPAVSPTRGREEPPARARRAYRDREPLIHVDNAGLVIAAPYLPRLFAMVNLLEGPTFKDDAAARRAVHLLQFMVDVRTDAPEHGLVLNKILCGVPLALPIERRIDATEHERHAIEGLIRGMIQNWQKIGQTSVTGFRESFLQRGGTLRLERDEWHLQVEPRAFDMLLDYIPWSFSVIKHAWMPQVVHVEWR
jgi:hypothetical protein